MSIDRRADGEAVDATDGEHATLSRRSLFRAGGALGALAALTMGSLPVSAEQAAASTADATLLKAFDAFLAALRRSAELAFTLSASRRPDDRAAGLRHILDNLSLGLAFYLHNADGLHPELMHYFDPARKQGGDNQDALYVGANLDGSQTYRLHGDRGTAKFFAVTVVEKGPTPWGGRSSAYLFGHDMKIEPDGRFEVILSPEPHPGNWLKLGPNTLRVTVRQFFADWENERPMRAMIRMFTTAYGESVSCTPMWAMGEPRGPIEKGTTYIVRPRMQPSNSLLRVSFISLGAIQLLVGPESPLLMVQIKVRSSTRATSEGSERQRKLLARFSGFRGMKVPVSTNVLHMRSYSSCEPSHQ